MKAFNRSQYERERRPPPIRKLLKSAVRAERVMAFFLYVNHLHRKHGDCSHAVVRRNRKARRQSRGGQGDAFVNYIVQMLHALMRIFIVFVPLQAGQGLRGKE